MQSAELRWIFGSPKINRNYSLFIIHHSFKQKGLTLVRKAFFITIGERKPN